MTVQYVDKQRGEGEEERVKLDFVALMTSNRVHRAKHAVEDVDDLFFFIIINYLFLFFLQFQRKTTQLQFSIYIPQMLLRGGK